MNLALFVNYVCGNHHKDASCFLFLVSDLRMENMGTLDGHAMLTFIIVSNSCFVMSNLPSGYRGQHKIDGFSVVSM